MTMVARRCRLPPADGEDAKTMREEEPQYAADPRLLLKAMDLSGAEIFPQTLARGFSVPVHGQCRSIGDYSMNKHVEHPQP